MFGQHLGRVELAPFRMEPEPRMPVSPVATFHPAAAPVEEEIVDAMKLIWKRMKIVMEPSSAVPLATILKNKDLFAGKRIGVIITGGNVDLDKLPWQ